MNNSTKLLIAIAMFFGACNSNYTMDDFRSVKKIDAHFHLNTTDTFIINQALQDNFKLVSLNTDGYGPVGIYIQDSVTKNLHQQFPNDIQYATTFSMKEWSSEWWADSAIAKIQKAISHGAVGIKMWKNIGTAERDKDSSFIMIDNPKFDPIFNYAEKNHIPVVGHFGDPRNGWLPVEKMTIRSDSNYFAHNPEFHFYNHPEIPNYIAQNAARDRVVEKHPNLIFVGAHFASLEWDVDEMAKRFDKYPNFYVDMSGRIWYLELQAKSDWQKVYDFLVKYHDRILYGTDLGSREGDSDPQGSKKYTHRCWTHDWQFITSSDTMVSEQFDGKFKAMHLPKNIVNDIYYNNAEKIFFKK